MTNNMPTHFVNTREVFYLVLEYFSTLAGTIKNESLLSSENSIMFSDTYQLPLCFHFYGTLIAFIFLRPARVRNINDPYRGEEKTMFRNSPFTVLAALIAVGLFPPAARAVLVNGSFFGSISQSQDLAGTVLGEIGYDLLLGESVNGTFAYETDLLPPDDHPSVTSISSFYEYLGTDWLSMAVTINSVRYDIINYGMHSEQRLMIQDDVYDSSIGTYDRILMEKHEYYYEDTSTNNDGSSFIKIGNSLKLGVLDENYGLFSSSDPGQSFSWTDDNQSSSGVFFIWDFSRDPSSWDYRTFAKVQFDITAISALAAPAGSPVPEPGTMVLLGSGLLGLAGYEQKRRKA